MHASRSKVNNRNRHAYFKRNKVIYRSIVACAAGEAPGANCFSLARLSNSLSKFSGDPLNCPQHGAQQSITQLFPQHVQMQKLYRQSSEHRQHLG
jgi:hypothetical protein